MIGSGGARNGGRRAHGRAAIGRARRALLVALVVPSLLAGACAEPDESPSARRHADGGGRAAAGSGNESANDRIDRTPLSRMPAFADSPWADAMKADQDRFDSLGKPNDRYGTFSLPDFRSDSTNVVDGERVTVRRPCPGCPHRLLWFVGTSAAFGLGQRDEHTIASELNRLGVESGIDLEVRNLGVPGVTSLDEVGGLAAHLRLDDRRPDMVVVYDGWNDLIAAYMHATVRDGALLDPIAFDGPWIEEYLDADPPPELAARHVGPLARHVARRVRENHDAMAAELSRRGIESAFFWQPDAFADPDQLVGLAQSLNYTMAQMSQRHDLSDLLAETTRRMGGAATDLRRVVPDIDVPVFADPVHMNEVGAAAMAEAIFADIEDRLR